MGRLTLHRQVKGGQLTLDHLLTGFHLALGSCHQEVELADFWFFTLELSKVIYGLSPQLRGDSREEISTQGCVSCSCILSF